jgi:hypothetical protein
MQEELKMDSVRRQAQLDESGLDSKVSHSTWLSLYRVEFHRSRFAQCFKLKASEIKQ